MNRTGRPKGSRNKSVKQAREAIADFVEQNAPRFNLWLEQVAGGIPQYDGNGEPVRDIKGSIVWLVKPDPASAIKLVGELTEYHLPKLSRADMTVVDERESSREISHLSTEELKLRLFKSLGLDVSDAQPADPPRLIGSSWDQNKG